MKNLLKRTIITRLQAEFGLRDWVILDVCVNIGSWIVINSKRGGKQIYDAINIFKKVKYLF